MNGKKGYTGGGYIQEEYGVPASVYEFIRSLTDNIYDYLEETDEYSPEELRNKYHQFISHVFASMHIEYEKKRNRDFDEIYIPVSSRVIEKTFGRWIQFDVLNQIEGLAITNYDWHSGKSREYKLSHDIFSQALLIDSDYILQSWKAMMTDGKCTLKMVNLMDGKPRVSKKNSLKTKNLKEKKGYETNRPKLIKQAIDSFLPCPFNPEKIYILVKAMRNKFRGTVKDLENIEEKYAKKGNKYNEAMRLKNKAQGIFLNDFRALKTILLQQPTPHPRYDNVFEYQTVYSVQSSGRLTERNGGFQGASQWFKELFISVPDKQPTLFNYDLKASQANILLNELRYCKLKSKWLANYLNGKKPKSFYPDKIGIDVATWKDCFYALVMGAEVENKFGDIYKSILAYCNDDKIKADKLWHNFLDVTSELREVVNDWRDYIYESNDRRYTYKHKQVKHWKNACGMRSNEYGIKQNENESGLILSSNTKAITNKNTIKKLKRSLAAFILQGQESCFIHNLTILCSNNKIPVYKNEHDGLITGKKIPDDLIEKAAKIANMPTPVFEIKSICSDAKRNSRIDFLGIKQVVELIK